MADPGVKQVSLLFQRTTVISYALRFAYSLLAAPAARPPQTHVEGYDQQVFYGMLWQNQCVATACILLNMRTNGCHTTV